MAIAGGPIKSTLMGKIGRSPITVLIGMTLIIPMSTFIGATIPRMSGYYVEGRWHPDPGARAVAGGVTGAGLGAAIGCVVTLPVGCAPGAAVGAAVGGGTGAVAGAASTPRD